MMYRFIFLLVLIIMAGCSTPPTREESSENTFRNVLLIISDDLATHAVGSYGNDIVQTPNIDRLASEGVRFEKAYANSPMCTPSRATIMTGRYPHATGVTLLRSSLPDSVITIAEILKSHDFATGIFGKTHFNSELKHGFDTLVNNREHRAYLAATTQPALHDSTKVRPQWKPFRDPARIWLNAEGATSGNHFEHSLGTFFAKSTMQFVEANKNKPFFAVASFREPHSPFNFSIEYQGKYNPEKLTLPMSSAEDERWVPSEFKDLTSPEKQGIIRSYYSSVEYMDRNVGYLLDELDRLGLAENTLVVFVGDHGYLLNHHGRFEKHMMWEEAVTTPLIIRGYRQGETVKENVELADLVPTMLSALGLNPLKEMHGKALQGLLTGEATSHREYTFSEYLTDNKAMITDGKWKYIFTTGKRDLGSGYETGLGPSGILHRLYDLKSDPGETTDLAAKMKYTTELHRLQNALLARFRETHPGKHSISEDLSPEEQLILFCEPPEGEDPGSF